MKTRYLTFILTFSYLALFTVAIYADDTMLEGAKLTKKYCADCHGSDGNGVDSGLNEKGIIPKIAGFSAISLYDSLDQFKQSDRKGKSLTINNIKTDMNQIVQKLKDEEVEAISLFLSKQVFIPAQQDTNPELVLVGKQLHQDLCENCHGKGGTSIADDAPILAGQWKLYLEQQFKNISEFKRYTPRKMKRKFKKLDENDKKALLEYYARNQK